jgi:hypothetical protein
MTVMSIYGNYEMMDVERDEQLDCVDRDEVEYHDALDEAEKAGEPWFSFAEFKARCEKAQRVAASKAVTLPAPPDVDDDLPF